MGKFMGKPQIATQKYNQIKGHWRRRRDSNPRYRIYQYDGLANRWFQPLTHVSGSQRRSAAYSEGFAGRQGGTDQVYSGFLLIVHGSINRITDSVCRPFIAGQAAMDSLASAKVKGLSR